MTNESNPLIPDDLRSCLEAILFVASAPVGLPQLADLLSRKPDEIEQALVRLQESYSDHHGLALQWHHNRVQLTTAPRFAGLIEKFLGLEFTSHLSRAALETLAIIAYRQPITRPGIDAIRGVSSDGVLKSLLSKGLLEEVGRAEGPGRPILFGTTTEFLQYFGLTSLKELPPYETVETPGGDQPLLKD
jgi:segregation and condensation protein B